jgi:rRNA-processing protein CGR1
MSTETLAGTAKIQSIIAPQGMRKNGGYSSEDSFCKGSTHSSPGKQWHAPRRAFRPRAGNSAYEKRAEERKAVAAVKAKEKEMKEEKEAERQVHFSPLQAEQPNQDCMGVAVAPQR